MKKSELKEMIKARVKGLMEAGKEVVITTQDGTSKTASSAEKLRAKQASDNDDVVTYQKRGATNESKEFLKMQKRAGLITESQYRELTEIKIKEPSSTLKTLDSNDIYFTPDPAIPDEMLTVDDNGDIENIDKRGYWGNNIDRGYIGPQTKDGYTYGEEITYIEKQSNGTWIFYWHDGLRISGFKENKDFIFGPKVDYDEISNISIKKK